MIVLHFYSSNIIFWVTVKKIIKDTEKGHKKGMLLKTFITDLENGLKLSLEPELELELKPQLGAELKNLN